MTHTSFNDLGLIGQKSRARTGTDQSQKRGPNQDSSKQNSGLAKVDANLRQTKRMTGKRHSRTSEARTGKGQAREGRDRTMPQKDMTKIDQVRQVST